MDRAALHEYVAGFEMDDRVIELHVNLARYDDGIIDGVRPMNPRRASRRELDDSEHRAVL